MATANIAKSRTLPNMVRSALRAALIACALGRSALVRAFVPTQPSVATWKAARRNPAAFLPDMPTSTAAATRRRRRGTSVAVAAKSASKRKKSKKDDGAPFLVTFFALLRRIVGAVTSVLLFPLRYLSRPLHSRFSTVQDIPSRFFGPNAPALRGRAVRITDGDTIRFLHTPSRYHPIELEKGQKLSEHALAIRLCTIDTPETAKFGKSGQPFGDDAKRRLKDLLEGRPVSVRLLQRDQYGRAVASVSTSEGHADETMLRDGLAEVYLGGGAVYGPLGKDGYLRIEKEAREAKRGIWSLKNRESAAEYKKRIKGEE